MIENNPWYPQPTPITPTAPTMSEEPSLPPPINPDYVEPTAPPINDDSALYLSPFTHCGPMEPLSPPPTTFHMPTLKETADNFEFYRYKLEQIAVGIFEGMGALGIFFVGAKILSHQNSSYGKIAALSCLTGSTLLGWHAKQRTKEAYRASKRDFYYKNVINNTENTLRIIDEKVSQITKRYETLRSELKEANKNFKLQTKGKPMTLGQMKTTRRNLQSLNDRAVYLLSTLQMVRI